MPAPRQKVADDALVPVKIEYGEKPLGKMARSAGGSWDPDVKLWYIRYGKIKGTELEKWTPSAFSLQPYHLSSYDTGI